MNDAERLDQQHDPRLELGIGVGSMIAVLAVIGELLGVGLALSLLVALSAAGVWLAWRLDARYGGVLP